MYTLIIAFYISLFGIIAMIALKAHEARTGRPTAVSRIGQGSDKLFHGLFSTVGRWFSYFNKKTLIVAAQWVAFHALVGLQALFEAAKRRALANPHSRKVIDAVRGRADIKYEGASFYLRRIADK